MTSKISNFTNDLINRIHNVNANLQNVDVDAEIISKNVQELMQGNGIKILNSIDELSTGYFLFYNTKGFLLVHDEQGLAKQNPISEDKACEILSLYYACRILSQIPKYYDKEIIKRIKQLILKVQE